MRTIDFLDKRVTGICNELKKLSVKQKFETSDWLIKPGNFPVSYTHLRAHETKANLVCRLLLEKKKKKIYKNHDAG